MEQKDSADSSPQRYSLPIHATIQALQNENGLRHRDHRRYRHYLTRRLKNVRHSIGLVFGRKSFVKKEILPESVKSPDYFFVLLLTAERAWSYSVELKDASTEDGKHKLIHDSIARLSKAAQWSLKLKDLCLLRADSQTALEATAYSEWMFGLLLLEKEKWTEAISKLLSAKAIYSELSRVGSLHDQDIFLARIQELEPAVRFCKFSVGSDIEKFDVDTFSSSPDLKAKFDEIRLKRAAEAKSNSSSGESIFEVSFAGKRIPVFDEDVKTHCSSAVAAVEKVRGRPAILDTAHSDGSLPRDREQLFSSALAAIDDALSVTSKRAAGLAASSALAASRGAVTSASSKVNEAKGALALLKYFLQFQRLRCLQMRNSDVISSLLKDSSRIVGSQLHSKAATEARDTAQAAQRVQELAHLYDQQLYLIRDMQNIPGIEYSCYS
jgi:hypothetical protein